MRGLFTVDRGIFTHPLFDREIFNQSNAWLWLISEASYKERHVRLRNGNIVTLKRGQLTASTRFMAEKWRWKEPRVRRFLERLKNHAMINTVSDAGQTVISICKYNIYQDFNNYRDAVDDAVNNASVDAANHEAIDAAIDANKNTRITPDNNKKEIEPKGSLSQKVSPNAELVNLPELNLPEIKSSEIKTGNGACSSRPCENGRFSNGEFSNDMPPRLYAVPEQPKPERPKPAEHRAEKHKPERPPDALAQALTQAVALWNETAERHGLPAVTKLTKPRRQKLKARLAELATPDDPDGLAGWEKALERLEQSDFLLGRTGKGWRANFDFLVNPNKFQQVIEGAYDTPPKSPAISGAGPPRGIGKLSFMEQIAVQRERMFGGSEAEHDFGEREVAS